MGTAGKSKVKKSGKVIDGLLIEEGKSHLKDSTPDIQTAGDIVFVKTKPDLTHRIKRIIGAGAINTLEYALRKKLTDR